MIRFELLRIQNIIQELITVQVFYELELQI
jgi:hypothetical protein